MSSIKNKLIVNMLFGSHLYGTNTLNSDKDYKGVFFPTKDQILLGNIPKSFNETSGDNFSKNTIEDVDIELFSLHQFIKLACEGQTVALDMLHAPNEFILESSPTWEKLRRNKTKFYTKNLNSFISYCKKQAAKYGVKGSRLDTAENFLNFLKNSDMFYNYVKINEIWDKLPITEHSKFIDSNNGIKQYQICGKIIQNTMSITYVYDIINKFYNNYGKRAKQAANNEGIDWKAISHAFRAAYQVKSILKNGDIKFPLKEASYLTKIKNGEFDYLTQIAPVLDELITEVEELTDKSNLPNKVNHKFWNNFLIEEIENNIIIKRNSNGRSYKC